MIGRSQSCIYVKDVKGQSMTEEMNYEMAENIDYSERDLE